MSLCLTHPLEKMMMRELLFHVCVAAGFFALGIGTAMTVDDFGLADRARKAWQWVMAWSAFRHQLAVAEPVAFDRWTGADDQWADTLSGMKGFVPPGEPPAALPPVVVSEAPALVSPSGPPAAVYAFRAPELTAELPVLEAESWEVPVPAAAILAAPVHRGQAPVYRGQALAERFARLMAECPA